MTRLWNNFQHHVHVEIFKVKKYKVVPHQSFDLDYVCTTLIYISICTGSSSMGLIPLLRFNKDFGEDLVLQFFATMYFERDDGRSFCWMSGSPRMRETMLNLFPSMCTNSSGSHTGFRDYSGAHIHHGNTLEFAYKEGAKFIVRCIGNMVPKYDA